MFQLAGGAFLYGSQSVAGLGTEKPSKGAPPTPSSMKNSPPEQGESSGTHSKNAVTGGTSTAKTAGDNTASKGKAAFQDAVKDTRSATPEQAMDNRIPGKDRVARGGN